MTTARRTTGSRPGCPRGAGLLRGALLLTLLAPACTYAPEPPIVGPADIGLRWRAETYALSPSLPPREVAQLLDALRRFGRGRLDGMQVSAAGPGDLRRLRDALEAAGVQPRKLTVQPVARPGPVVVVAERAEAEAPPCPGLALRADGYGPNPRRPGLGCTNTGNLAAQVADPADLLGNDADPYADGDRAANPVAAYRAPRTSQPAR